MIVAAHLADAFTTIIGIQRGGRELNPLVDTAIQHLGLAGVVVWKLGILVMIYAVWKYTPTTDTPFPTHQVILRLAFLGGLIPAVWNSISIATGF